MKATVTYRLSEAGRKVNILAGGDGKEYQEIEVGREDPNFARVVSMGTISDDIVNAHDDGDRWDTIPDVGAVLDRIEARKAKVEADELARVEAKRRETMTVLAERRTETAYRYDLGDSYQVAVPDWPYDAPEDITRSPEALAWIAELDVAAKAAKQAKIAEIEAKRTAKEAAEKRAAEEEAARRAELGLGPDDDDFTIEAGALSQVPVWETHRRGKNWMAIVRGLDPKSPGGIVRDFCDKAKGDYYYLLPDLEIGDAIEFGGDYYTGGGSPRRDRWHGFVVRIDADRLVMRKCKTAADALKAGAKFRAESVAV